MKHLTIDDREGNVNVLKVRFPFKWEAVLSSETEEYFFPQSVTGYMKRLYRGPYVYRWNIYRNSPSDLKLLYVGQAKQLCPHRIQSYLTPGPSQETNQRIHEKLRAYLEQGLRIRLEILRFVELTIGDFALTPEDMLDKHTRLFIEGLLIVYLRRKGYALLNL